MSIGIERAVKEYAVGNKQLHLTTAQFYEKTEEVRDRLLMEAKRLGVGLPDMQRMFLHDKSIPRTAFKRRLVEMGFSLADFPDDDFVVLDENNDGSISKDEFIHFFRQGVEMNDPTNVLPPPAPPPDDLVFQPIDLAGVLTVIVNGAKGLRRGAAWFAPETKADTLGNSATVESSKTVTTGRPKFFYDAEAAGASHDEPLVVAALPSARSEEEAPPLPVPSNLTLPHDAADKGLAVMTPYSKMPGGEFLSAPNTLDTERGGLMSPRSHFGGEEEKEISRTALEAGSKLHHDPLLQSTEARRSSKFLLMMREKAKESKGGSVHSNGDNGLLISKNRVKPSRVDKRGALEDVLRYLGMSDQGIVRHVAKFSDPNKVLALKPRASAQSSNGQPHAGATAKGVENVKDSYVIVGGRYAGREEDIWDVFVDRVAVICSCRSPSAVVVSKRLNSRFLKHTSFDNLLPPPSPIPVPRSVGASGGKTPRLQSRSANPSAAMTTARQSVRSNQHVSTNAIYDTLIKQESEVSYVEVFRRVIPIPLCSFAKVRFHFMSDIANCDIFLLD